MVNETKEEAAYLPPFLFAVLGELRTCRKGLRDNHGLLRVQKLEEAFESRLSQYIESRSAPYYRVSTEVAAKKNADMKRAKSDLEEHQLVCVSAA